MKLKSWKDPGSKKWSRSGPATLLVNPVSATQGRSWETSDNYKVSINADHSGMVKFSEYDRDGYEKVRDVLKDFISHAGVVIGARMRARTGEDLGPPCTLLAYIASLRLNSRRTR